MGANKKESGKEYSVVSLSVKFLLQYRNFDAAVLGHAFFGGIVGDGAFASASAANEFVGVDSALAKLGGDFFCALNGKRHLAAGVSDAGGVAVYKQFVLAGLF